MPNGTTRAVQPYDAVGLLGSPFSPSRKYAGSITSLFKVYGTQFVYAKLPLRLPPRTLCFVLTAIIVVVNVRNLFQRPAVSRLRPICPWDGEAHSIPQLSYTRAYEKCLYCRAFFFVRFLSFFHFSKQYCMNIRYTRKQFPLFLRSNKKAA